MQSPDLPHRSPGPLNDAEHMRALYPLFAEAALFSCFPREGYRASYSLKRRYVRRERGGEEGE